MPVLYLVATPIGNLGDLSPRAVKTLGEVDFIAAEDTRVTIKLLNHFDIKKPMISYYEHNLRERGREIIQRILNGENCAIVTDAGMPCISDPGEDLVRLCAENGIETVVIPGPSAVVCALAVSGLATGRFCFEGFLSMKKNSRIEHLNAVKDDDRTLVFYEAPHKLQQTLKDILEVFGQRKITLVREITKLHEEIIRTTLEDAVKIYEQRSARGEFVLVIEGAKKAEPEKIDFCEAVAYAKDLMEQGEPASKAAREAAKATGYAKSEIYRSLF